MSNYLVKEKQYGKRELTEKHLALLDYLPKCNYDPIEAAKQAGYEHPYGAVKSLRNEIKDIAESVIANSSIKAAQTLNEVLHSERPVPNMREKIDVAKTLLDRAGFAKKELVQHEHKVQGGVFIMPEKKEPVDGEFTIHEDSA